MNPTTAQTIIAALIEIAVGGAVVYAVIWFTGDWWRLRPGKHRHTGCYGRGDSCEIKFVSGGKR